MFSMHRRFGELGFSVCSVFSVFMLDGAAPHEDRDMPMIINQTYRFQPPGGDAPIVIYGLQEYSPGQVRKVDVWKLNVPEPYRELISDGEELTSYGSVIRALARLFCDADEQKAKALISS